MSYIVRLYNSTDLALTYNINMQAVSIWKKMVAKMYNTKQKENISWKWKLLAHTVLTLKVHCDNRAGSLCTNW